MAALSEGVPRLVNLLSDRALEVDPEAAGYSGARVRQYVDESIARLRTVPGVKDAAYGRIIPVGIGGSRVSISVPGYAAAAASIGQVQRRKQGEEDIIELQNVLLFERPRADEIWLYKATGVVQNLTSPDGPTSTFSFSGNTASDGA